MKLAQLFLTESEDENKDIDKAPDPGKLGEFITTKQAAKILGVTPSRVRQFIQSGRLKSYEPETGRRDNLLKLSEVNKFDAEERPITGRPEGSKEGSGKN